MFFWKKDKHNVELLMMRVLSLAERLERLEKAAYGFKKDGTPRAKPGRKVGS